MKFVNVKTGEFIGHKELRRRLNTSLPPKFGADKLDGTDYAVVIETPRPVVEDGQVSELNGYSKTENEWIRQWAVREKTSEEVAEAQRDARRADYPPIGDQLDAIMKWLAGENEITVTPELKSVAMKCMSVKSKHPITAEKEAAPDE